jgi:hypothetical protein
LRRQRMHHEQPAKHTLRILGRKGPTMKYLSKMAIRKYGRHAVMTFPLPPKPSYALLGLAYDTIAHDYTTFATMWVKNAVEIASKDIQKVADKKKEILRAYKKVYDEGGGFARRRAQPSQP